MNNHTLHQTLLGTLVVLAGLAFSNPAISDTLLADSSEGYGIANGKMNDVSQNDSRSDNGQQIDFRAEQYQALILDIVELSDQAASPLYPMGYSASIENAVDAVLQLDQYQLEQLIQSGPPIEQLRQRLEQSKAVIDAALKVSSGSARQKAISFPEPQTTIAECNNVSGAAAYTALLSLYSARELLALLFFPCLQSIGGFNDASACAAFKILDASLDAANMGVQACMQEQRDAYLDAILETEENIADHLVDFVDATTSSRATQDSVDDVQSEVSTGLSLLDTLQSDLDTDLASLESDLIMVMIDLDDLLDDAVELAATAGDIQFRVQENQVDIEDAQIRAADAEATAEEIRTDTQSIISSIETLQNDLDEYTTSLSSGLAATERSALIAALADENTRIVRFLLPGSAGGELEQVRELVIQAITAFSNLGVDTSTSTALLVQGDADYNQGQYINAYTRFAQAYRALTMTDDTAKPGIRR